MKDLPHRYKLEARARAEGNVALEAPGLEPLESAPPAEFGGPGDRWSPETLLVAAVADCFILTFRAMARASKLEWHDLVCEAEGVLDKTDDGTRFTEIRLVASLTLAPDQRADRAERLLERAEKSCLVTNSLRASVALETRIETRPSQ